jgi:uncharacterized SAM-binding protein YcdF (DUF218 family)
MISKLQPRALVIPFPKSAQPRPRRRWKRALLVVLVLAAAVLAFLGVTAWLVARQGWRDEARAADAIVVFGAAEYAGRPSPVFKARLDHGFELYRRGLAPVVITTGGAGADPTYNEGGVGRDYLSRRGIPDHDLIAETQSDDTAESAERVSAILRANGWHTVVAVSDAYHMYRVKQLLQRKGVVAYASPRPDSVPHYLPERVVGALREAFSLVFSRVVPR